MYLLLLLSILSFCSARNVMLFGDSITMDMKHFNYNMFETTDSVINYGRSAFSTELVRLIIDPNRDYNRLMVALEENPITSSYQPYQVIVPDIRNNPPEIISIMIGLRNIFNGADISLVPSHLNEYKLLLNLLESLLPSNTIILINSILPMDNTGYHTSFKNLMKTVTEEFNRQLKIEIENRSYESKLDYRFVDLYQFFLKNDSINPDLFLHQGEMLLHPSLQGYNVWKEHIRNVLNNDIEVQNNPVLHIRTNHWDTKEHRNFFQLFINDDYIDSFVETKAMLQIFTINNQDIRKIEIIMSTWE